MNLPTFEPCTIWITGITASGKTTLGQSLFEFLVEKGVSPLEFLDGDELRKRLDKTCGHSMEDRLLVLGKIVEIAQENNQTGTTVIVSTVSHKKAMRDYARAQIPRFMEVYLDCSLESCAVRDNKGLYQLAYEGEYDLFPGVTERYELSDAPELTLDTDRTTPEECANVLFREVAVFLGVDS
jgi:adenylylsulfate kinase